MCGAVNSGRMLEASLGYYINPLVQCTAGHVASRRTLASPAMGCRRHWPAVGVAQQVWQVGSLPWVSLVLALTFGFYGLIRKQAPGEGTTRAGGGNLDAGAIAVAWLLFNPSAHSAQLAFWSTSEAWWLVAAGPGNAQSRWCASTPPHGICRTPRWVSLQYVAPTLVLLEAVLLFGERLAPSTLIAFAFIWAWVGGVQREAWLTVRKR